MDELSEKDIPSFKQKQIEHQQTAFSRKKYLGENNSRVDLREILFCHVT